MSAFDILKIAHDLLAGKPVSKSENEVDPDALPENADTRAQGASPDEKSLDAARGEAQSNQMQNQVPGVAGNEGNNAPPTEPDEDNAGGESDNDEDNVSKAELIESMKFLADAHGITVEDITKAFSGLEGDPTQSKHPVGKGEELLEQIVTGVKDQSKILEAIASAILDLSKSHVKLGDEVAKSLEASESAKTAAAQASALVGSLPKTAASLPAKAEDIVKGGEGSKPLTSHDLFQMALAGQIDPVQAAKLNRTVNAAGAAIN